jgi:phosphate transport system substrate-binding protein
MLMEGRLITPRAIVQNTNGSVRQLVSSDRYSIGFISMGLVNDRVKSLSLDGVPANWQNVMDGNYTLYRPFIFVADDAPTGGAMQFYEFAVSEEGQRILMEEGLVTGVGGR